MVEPPFGFSSRSAASSQHAMSYVGDFLQFVNEKPFHHIDNAAATINFCVAENKIMSRKWIRAFDEKVFKSKSSCRIITSVTCPTSANGSLLDCLKGPVKTICNSRTGSSGASAASDDSFPPSLLGYFDFSGYAPLKQAIIDNIFRRKDFFGEDAVIDPADVMISDGVGPMLVMLGMLFSDATTMADADTSTSGNMVGSWIRSLGSPRGNGLAAGDGGSAASPPVPVQRKIMYLAPRYPGFAMDFRGFAQIDVAVVNKKPGALHRIPSNDELDAAFYSESLGNVRTNTKNGRPETTISAFLLCNPDNPTGCIYPWEDLTRLVEWCRRKQIFLISDEIYAFSVLEEASNDPKSAKFRSLFQYADVTLWGMSKDFALSGARLSVAYVNATANDKNKSVMGPAVNAELKSRWNSMCVPYCVSGVAQYVFHKLLSDRVFVDNLIREGRKTLSKCWFQYVKPSLEDKERIGLLFIKPDAAMFCWVDFSEICAKIHVRENPTNLGLASGTNPSRSSPTKREKAPNNVTSLVLMRLLLHKYKVFVTPGWDFWEQEDRHQIEVEKGEVWVRLCYAACGSYEALEVGLQRLEQFVKDARSKTHAEV